MKTNYNMTIVVCFDGMSAILNTGDLKNVKYWLDGHNCDDNCFKNENLPREQGVYDCIVEHAIYTDHESGYADDWEFIVLNAVKIL